MSKSFNTPQVEQVEAVRKVYMGVRMFAMPVGVEEKCMDSGVFNSKLEYDTAKDECKKWLALCIVFANSGVRLGMVSEKVDEVWHQFILFTLSYHEFCAKFNSGNYLHHIPNVNQDTEASDGQSVDNFRKVYETCFGRLNDIWPQGNTGIFSDCGTTESGSGCTPTR